MFAAKCYERKFSFWTRHLNIYGFFVQTRLLSTRGLFCSICVGRIPLCRCNPFMHAVFWLIFFILTLHSSFSSQFLSGLILRPLHSAHTYAIVYAVCITFSIPYDLGCVWLDCSITFLSFSLYLVCTLVFTLSFCTFSHMK